MNPNGTIDVCALCEASEQLRQTQSALRQVRIDLVHTTVSEHELLRECEQLRSRVGFLQSQLDKVEAKLGMMLT